LETLVQIRSVGIYVMELGKEAWGIFSLMPNFQIHVATTNLVSDGN
jgi:hypothetical protein